MPNKITATEHQALASILAHPTLAILLPGHIDRAAVQQLIARGLAWNKSGVLHATERGEAAMGPWRTL
jgi:uncharacterized protein YciW